VRASSRACAAAAAGAARHSKMEKGGALNGSSVPTRGTRAPPMPPVRYVSVVVYRSLLQATAGFVSRRAGIVGHR